MLSAQQLVEQHLELPSLPAIVVRLNELLAKGLPSMGQIAELVSEDPALAARVLRLVNSPLYPFRNNIDSVQRATTLIGVRELRNLALAASVGKLFRGIDNPLVTMEQFWRHSLYVALLCRGIGEAAGQREVDRYFVMGLLHDLGELVLFRQLPEQVREAADYSQTHHLPLADAERHVIGFNHADVGAELMRHWHLPDNIVAAVGGHHDRQADGEHRLAIGIVYLGNMIATNMEEATLGLGFREGIGISAWERVNVRHGVHEPLMTEARSRFDAAHQALFAAA